MSDSSLRSVSNIYKVFEKALFLPLFLLLSLFSFFFSIVFGSNLCHLFTHHRQLYHILNRPVLENITKWMRYLSWGCSVGLLRYLSLSLCSGFTFQAQIFYWLYNQPGHLQKTFAQLTGPMGRRHKCVFLINPFLDARKRPSIT